MAGLFCKELIFAATSSAASSSRQAAWWSSGRTSSGRNSVSVSRSSPKTSDQGRPRHHHPRRHRQPHPPQIAHYKPPTTGNCQSNLECLQAARPASCHDSAAIVIAHHVEMLTGRADGAVALQAPLYLSRTNGGARPRGRGLARWLASFLRYGSCGAYGATLTRASTTNTPVPACGDDRVQVEVGDLRQVVGEPGDS